jgi:hypothetical protein
METSPKNCGLLGGNRNTLKLKTAAKLKDKRTWIATAPGLYRMNATFLTSVAHLVLYSNKYVLCSVH